MFRRLSCPGLDNGKVVTMEVNLQARPVVTPCGSGSDGSEEFLPLYGTEWKALVGLPVAPEPGSFEVGTKA